MLRFGIVIVALGMAGCATLPGDVQDDMNAVIGVVDQWSTAIIAHDVDALLTLYSEDFSDGDGNNKADFRVFIIDTIGQGILDNLEVITDDAEITLDGDVATYTGIDLSGDMGGISVDLTLGREGDGWAIVSMIAG